MDVNGGIFLGVGRKMESETIMLSVSSVIPGPAGFSGSAQELKWPR